MSALLELPPEILEQILLELDPIEASKASRTCRLLHDIVYHPTNELFWRKLYLRQPFDDPRKCITPLGYPLQDFDYKRGLQRIIRARTVVTKPQVCREDERVAVVETLRDMAIHSQPLPSETSDELSRNLVWLAALLRNGAFLDDVPWTPTDRETQLRAHLHTLFGLSPADYEPHQRLASRARVYELEHYNVRNDWGPFVPDGSGRVSWEQLRAVHHVVAMHVVGEHATPSAYTIFPLSLPYAQGVAVADGDKDWAGVAGRWQFAFCFIDHRALLELNDILTASNGSIEERRARILGDPEFSEVFGGIDITLTLVRTEEDPVHPARPVLHFRGRGGATGGTTMEGWVRATPDGHVRWHFESGQNGDNVWSSEGVQIGGLRSAYGVLGTWSTADHDFGDPVGPFWMRRLPHQAQHASGSAGI